MSNINLTLIVVPGPGVRQITIPEGSTISDLVCQESLHGRDIIVNGTGVPANQYNTTLVQANSEVFATGSVKGNANNLTLIVVPGTGVRPVSFETGMTVSDLVCQESLHGRDIIINGTGVPTNQYETTLLVPNSEVFATGSVKGNF